MATDNTQPEPDDANADQVDDVNDGTQDADKDPEGADKLGDPGKKALDAMKAERNAAKADARAVKAQLAELQKQLEALQQGGKKDEDKQPDVEALKKQIREEAAAEALRERALDKIVVQAAKKFEDPEDARAFLSSQVGDFIDGNKIDLKSIDEAIEELLEKRPYLAAQSGRRFQGGNDGGTRKGSEPNQVTEEQIKKMNPYQIEKARQEGRLKDLLGG